MDVFRNGWFYVVLIVGLILSFNYNNLNQRQSVTACNRLPVVDGRVEVIEPKTGMSLHIPSFAHVTRYANRGCENAQSFGLSYLWYEGMLIPEYTYDERVKKGIHKKGHYLPVKIYFRGASEGKVTQSRFSKAQWHYQPAIPHKNYPLEYYPRYYWDDPENPSEKSLKRASLDHIWGVRDTKYQPVNTSTSYTVSCNIAALDPLQPNSRVQGEFIPYGDAKCRGVVSSGKNGKQLYFMVDVWANTNPKFQAIKEINLVYDALVEEIKTFIK
ncbi:hypothetical protein [Thalassotalea ganghwensis]